MPVVEAQVKREFARLYPGLEPGQWYPVDQTSRDIESDAPDELVINAGGRLVEVKTEHIARRVR